MKIQQRKRFSIFLVVCISLVIGFIAGYLAGFRYGKDLSKENFIPAITPSLPAQAPSQELSSEALEIVKELNCICGCGMELMPCTCEEPLGSKEIKLFVQGLVNRGLAKPDVIERLVDKYNQKILIKKSS